MGDDGGVVEPNHPPDPPERDGRGLVVLGVISGIGGLLVGVAAGSFRWLLTRADGLRVTLVDSAHGLPGPGWLVPMALVALCAAFARLIVRYVPSAAGSGIQDVEAVWRGEEDAPTDVVLPAKYVGGLLGIGSGLALGREGPTVHMGAVIGASISRRVHLSNTDSRILQTAFGGAGLAVAFNAPLGGALFVFEEVTKSFRLRLVLVTLIGCATAISASRLFMSDRSDFAVASITTQPGWHLVIFVMFGVLTGFLGVLYNRAIMEALHLSDRFSRVAPEARAALIGAIIGLLLYINPLIAGDGHQLTQHLLGGGVSLSAILIYVALRFMMGPISYAAGTPGGLFAPLLVLGAGWGLLCHGVLHAALPGITDQPGVFAIVGMAAFFTAVVRAPFTGIVLIVEMTATTTVLIPLLAAAFAAMLTATLMRSAPIYDSLWVRALAHPGAVRTEPGDHPS